VKNCGLIYPGNSQSFSYPIKNNINLHVIVIDLEASNSEEFEEKLIKFKKTFYVCLVYPLFNV